MLELYIRDGKPTRMLIDVRRNIEKWQATLNDPVDISDWPDEVIANLDMAIRDRLAMATRSVADVFEVVGMNWSCIPAWKHRSIRQSLFDRAKAELQPVHINGKSYSISAARDLLDARENARAS